VTRLKPRLIAMWLAVGLAVLGNVFMFWGEASGIRNAARKPDAFHRRTVPYNDHGTVIYIKQWQSDFVNYGMTGGLIGTAVVVALMLTATKKREEV